MADNDKIKLFDPGDVCSISVSTGTASMTMHVFAVDCTVENVFHIGGFREKMCPDDMPKLSPSSVALLDGAIVLSRRDGTARWQARFKNGSRWIRVTTKAKDLNDAKEVAHELYMDARYRVKHGIPAQSKRFKDVAKLAVDRMEKAMAAGEGRSVYRDYVQAITNYLIPFFGTHHVDHITYPLIQAFAAWRAEKMCKEPKASTLNTYNSALNRIFDEALMRGYIAKTQVPILENRGCDAQRHRNWKSRTDGSKDT